MLKAIDNISGETAESLFEFFNDGITDAYVLFSLLDWENVDGAWIQAQGENITALVVKRETAKVYVTAIGEADYYELADFIAGLGGVVVHCPTEITARIGVTGFSKISLMALEQEITSEKKSITVNDNLRRIFDLLTQSRKDILKNGIDRKDMKKYSERAYKEWLKKTDRGMKKGYTTIRAVTAGENAILSTAVADRLRGIVYIREIATDKDFYKMGYATDCIAGLCNDFKSDNDLVFIACDDIKTENFYKKLGFKRKDYLELGIVEL